MNNQEKTLWEQAEAVYDDILTNKARGNNMKAKLQAVNEACKKIVEAKGTPTPANVIEWIAVNRTSAIFSVQTIYNDRSVKLADGSQGKAPSHYQIIIDAWALVSADRNIANRGNASPVISVSGIEITDQDLVNIPDLTVRHKISVMLGQFNGLKNQANMRGAIKNNPPVPGIEHVHANMDAIDYDMALDEDEIDALTDFLTEKVAKRRGLEFNEVGTVIAVRVDNGKALSKPAFVDAIRKILKSYDAEFLINKEKG